MSNDQTKISAQGSEPRPGPFLARVISHMDSTYMGMLQVEILRPTGNTGDSGQLHQVKYMSPFYGVTSADFVREDPNNYSNTQKSYGFWAVPPDVGTTVVVIFIDGDPKRGYWMGCVQDEGMNFMVPGIAATESVVDETDRMPVAEYNKQINSVQATDATKNKKPRHPLADALESQGLLKDDIRGLTTSSARRDIPSMVFGMSTPGPVDKRPGSPRGAVGKEDYKIPNAFVGRLGGSTFVMDDGDDKFLRKKPAKDGPPEYASVLQKETDGDVTIPHNELIRLRTRTGHQILLHTSEDLIYITNSRGTSWIELTSDGKIDIYAEDSISVHTANDINFYADRDINMEAGRNFNVKAASKIHTESGDDTEIISGAATKITTSGALDINSGATNKFTSGGDTHIKASNTAIDGGNINLNSGVASAAESAEVLSTFELPTEVEGATIETIMLRVPSTEPYPHHENLDPESFKPDMTDRDSGSAGTVPTAFQTYTTTTDTFNKVQGAEEEEQ